MPILKPLLAVLVVTAISAASFFGGRSFQESVTPQVVERYKGCATPEHVLQIAFEKYGELPVYFGAGEEGIVSVLLLNEQKGNWTFVEMVGEQACVISVGSVGKMAKASGEMI